MPNNDVSVDLERCAIHANCNAVFVYGYDGLGRLNDTEPEQEIHVGNDVIVIESRDEHALGYIYGRVVSIDETGNLTFATGFGAEYTVNVVNGSNGNNVRVELDNA